MNFRETQTDADPSNWPKLRARKVDANGAVDYLAPADKEVARLWKERIATGLCNKAEIPSNSIYLPRYFSTKETKASSVPTLADFPPGYILLTHYKGDKDSPRRDTYLYGKIILPGIN